MIGGGNLFSLKFWVKLTALERNRRFSIYFRPYSTSAVNLAKKVQLTLIGVHHALSNEPKMNIVRYV